MCNLSPVKGKICENYGVQHKLSSSKVRAVLVLIKNNEPNFLRIVRLLVIILLAAKTLISCSVRSSRRLTLTFELDSTLPFFKIFFSLRHSRRLFLMRVGGMPSTEWMQVLSFDFLFKVTQVAFKWSIFHKFAIDISDLNT